MDDFNKRHEKQFRLRKAIGLVTTLVGKRQCVLVSLSVYVFAACVFPSLSFHDAFFVLTWSSFQMAEFQDEAWHDSGTEPAKEDKPTTADLFFALRRQELAIIPRILKAFPEMWKAQDDDGHTILHWVALFGHLPLTQQCIEFGVKVDVEATGTKQTALMWACLKGHIHVAQAWKWVSVHTDASRDALSRQTDAGLMVALPQGINCRRREHRTPGCCEQQCCD